MVLNGIGGKSIAEAQNNLTLSEVMIWAAYRSERGGFNIGRRVEQATGNLMAHYTRYHSKDPESVNALAFMPHEDYVPDDELSLEEYFEKYHSDGA